MAEQDDFETIDDTHLATGGNWTQFPKVRSADGNTIVFDPDEKPGSPFTMRLRIATPGEHTDILGETVIWEDGEHGKKTLATGVPHGTQFVIEARSSDGKTHLNGKLFIRED